MWPPLLLPATNRHPTRLTCLLASPPWPALDLLPLCPLPDATPVPCPPSTHPPATPAGDNPDCKYYTVQAGDTLSGIAMNLGLTQMDLEELNPNALTLQPNTFVNLTGW